MEDLFNVESVLVILLVLSISSCLFRNNQPYPIEKLEPFVITSYEDKQVKEDKQDKEENFCKNSEEQTPSRDFTEILKADSLIKKTRSFENNLRGAFN